MNRPFRNLESGALAVGGAILSGVLQVLVFPRWSLAWLAPFCLVPLLLSVKEHRARDRLLLGWLAGCVFFAGTCYWIYPVMRDYASISPPIAAFLFVLFFLVKGVQCGAFALLGGPLLQRAWAVPGLATLWVALEGSHQYVFFTWTLLGNAAIELPLSHIARLAPWTGVYGPSFVFALANAVVAVAFVRKSPKPLIALVPILGLLAVPSLPSDGEAEHTARLVQPNVHPDVVRAGWVQEHGTDHLSRMLQISRAPSGERRPLLLVWPEYPVSAYYFDDAAARAYFERVAVESGSAFIFNTISFVDGDRSRPRNSSVTLGRDGGLLADYSKVNLVPFGEFVPWPFHYFVTKITLQAGMFHPGEAISTALIDGHGVGTFICYESVFGGFVREFTAAGAQLLVNISNDSWYGRSAAREQHLLIARLRAIENDRWILRATNDGITAAISPSGRVVDRLPSYVQDYIDVPFSFRSTTTAFVRHGEWLWWVCLLAAGVQVTYRRVVGNRESKRPRGKGRLRTVRRSR